MRDEDAARDIDATADDIEARDDGRVEPGIPPLQLPTQADIDARDAGR